MASAYETSAKCLQTGHAYKDEVHIAFGSVFAVSHRAEETDIARAVTGGEAQDFVAMLSYALARVHLSNSIAKGRADNISRQP